MNRHFILFSLLTSPILFWSCQSNVSIIEPSPSNEQSLVQSPTNSNPSSSQTTPDNNQFSQTSSPVENPLAISPSISSNENIYCSNVDCSPINESDVITKLKNPGDLVVTHNGKKVYVLNGRLIESCTNYNKKTIDRQFIYEINENKDISIVKVDGQYPFSCQLSGQIEIDKNDNLYITKPLIDITNRFLRKPYSGHEIYKITPDKKMNKFSEIIIKNPLPSATPTLPSFEMGRVLSNMNITEDNKMIYLLSVDNAEGSDSIQKIDDKNNIESLINYTKSGESPLPFRYYNGKLYSYQYKITIPDKVNSRINRILENSENIYQGKLPVEGYGRTSVSPNGDVYIIVNSIYRK